MKDWLGRAWDSVVQSLGGLIVRQRWTDYKQWADFGGEFGNWREEEDIGAEGRWLRGD